MAIYIINPEKDSTIYPDFPTMNTGLDEILEIIPSDAGSSRILTKFSQEKIEEVSDIMLDSFEQNELGLVSGSYEVNFKLFNCYLENINKDVIVELYPISGSWDMGVGRYRDNPLNFLGVAWNYKFYEEGGEWDNPGGDYIPEYKKEYKFKYYDNQDLNFDVTNIIDDWYDGVINNEGFLIKTNLNELNKSILKFYSRDTHTIYKPQLIFKWDDSVYSEDEDNLINTESLILSINKKPEYKKGDVLSFKINVAEKFPARTFTTQYLYSKKHLPQNSWYALYDIKTNQYLIDFDEKYTKVSSSNGQSYFKLFTEFLDLERFYEIHIKTVINGSTVTFKDNSPFKIIS